MTAWGIVSFTKDGDKLLGQQMADWGKANNVDVEYVALPGSDYDVRRSLPRSRPARSRTWS